MRCLWHNDLLASRRLHSSSKLSGGIGDLTAVFSSPCSCSARVIPSLIWRNTLPEVEHMCPCQGAGEGVEGMEPTRANPSDLMRLIIDVDQSARSGHLRASSSLMWWMSENLPR